MNKSLSLCVQSICLIILVFVFYAAYCGYNNGLSTADFFAGVTKAAQGDYESLICLVIISLQLCLMRWDKAVFNAALCVLSFALMAELVCIILGPKIAFTAPLQQLLAAEGMPHALSSFSALYWLTPLLWMMALTRAGAQVRIFCTAMFCYLAWIALTPLFCELVEFWKNYSSDVMPQVLDIYRNATWMESVTIGGFLLLYALFISLMEAIFPDSTPKK